MNLLELLNAYKVINKEEESQVNEIINFINTHPNCFHRTEKVGHITGSAWIVDPTFSYSLLTHHKKLNMWYQLGGHSDGEKNTLNVALREAEEESGIQNIKSYSNEIFAIDIQKMPEYKDEPEHIHYDIVFLFIADMKEKLVLSTESKDLSWVKLEEISSLVKDKLITKLIDKTKALKLNLN